VANYTELAALQHFVLEETWVLGIVATPGVLRFEVDFTFAKDHPELLPPRDGETNYGRLGVLSFSGVSTLSWTDQGHRPATDARGELDWGAIDSLSWTENSFELVGDFGRIRVDAAALEVVLTGPV
jgi:hypothetical protein